MRHRASTSLFSHSLASLGLLTLAGCRGRVRSPRPRELINVKMRVDMRRPTGETAQESNDESPTRRYKKPYSVTIKMRQNARRTLFEGNLLCILLPELIKELEC